jgi:hypothetical protein
MAPGFAAKSATSGTLELRVKDVPLYSGMYTISIWFGEKNQNHVTIPDAATFHLLTAKSVPAGISLDVVGSMCVDGRFAFLE